MQSFPNQVSGSQATVFAHWGSLTKTNTRSFVAAISTVCTILSMILGSSCQSSHQETSTFIELDVLDQKVCVATDQEVFCTFPEDGAAGRRAYESRGRLFSVDTRRNRGLFRQKMKLKTREDTCLGVPNDYGNLSIYCAQWIYHGVFELPMANNFDVTVGNGLESIVCRATNAGAVCHRFITGTKRRLLSTHPLVEVDGGSHHVCGLDRDGDIHCAGIHTDKMLPAGVMNYRGSGCGQLKPPKPTRFKSISAGLVHNCALAESGEAWCWGAGDHSTHWGCVTRDRVDFGQARPPNGKFVSLASGDYHSCGLRPDSTVKCWGKNDKGQATPPQRKLQEIAAGGDSTCGITKNDEIVCWGAAAGRGEEIIRQLQRKSSRESATRRWDYVIE